MNIFNKFFSIKRTSRRRKQPFREIVIGGPPFPQKQATSRRAKKRVSPNTSKRRGIKPRRKTIKKTPSRSPKLSA